MISDASAAMRPGHSSTPPRNARGQIVGSNISSAISTSAIAQGDRLVKQGRCEEAIRLYDRAIRTGYRRGSAWASKGVALKRLERLDEAIPWLKKALEAERYCCVFYAHTNLGRVYLLKGLMQLAKKHFQEALEANPGYEPAREMLRRADRKMDYFA